MMAATDITVTVRANTTLVRAGLCAFAWLAPVIGVDRTWRLARWWAYRTTFYRVDNGPWRRLTPNMEDPE